MGIKISRFDKEKSAPAHAGTILAMDVLPEGVKAPFSHAYGYLENGNAMEPHAHPTPEIYIVFSGRGAVVVDGEWSEVFPGDVINIPPNAEHSMIAQPEGAFLWAAFWWDVVFDSAEGT